MSLFMNSQLVGTNICIDVWKVLSNRPYVLPTKRHPIITYIVYTENTFQRLCLIKLDQRLVMSTTWSKSQRTVFSVQISFLSDKMHL